jgi:hypothetical protein
MTACARRGRAIAAVRNANEIFYNLDSRRVYYDSAESWLYFVDAPQDPVKNIITAALRGMGVAAVIEQLHLDTHRFFNAASRVSLGGGQADTVLIALRLAGLGVTVR